jgi:hypothetical protein
LKSAAGLLEKITYPEGGSRVFTYEHNKVFNIFPGNLLFKNTNPIVERDTVISSFNRYNGYFYEIQFTAGANVIGTGTATVIFDDPAGCNPGGPDDLNVVAGTACMYQVTLSGRSLDGVGSSFSQHFVGTSPAISAFSNDPITGIKHSMIYKLRVTPMYGNHQPNIMGKGFRVFIRWQEELDSDIMYGGGKRIKQIDYKATPDAVSMTKTFSYNNPDTGKTSGWAFGLPNFYSTTTTAVDGVTTIEPYGAVGGSLFSTFQEGTLGYGTVTEFDGEGNNTVGKKVHTFSMIPDTGLYYQFPYHIPTDNEWLRGIEESVTLYKKTAIGYNPVKKIENHYLYGDFTTTEGNTPSTPGIFNPIPIYNFLSEDMTVSFLSYRKDKRMFRLPLPIIVSGNTIYNGGGSSEIYGYKVYHITGGTVDLLSTTTTDYFEGGSELKTTTNYSYDYNEHYNPATVSMKGSDGKNTTTKYFYPQDSEMVGKPNVAALISKNMVATPLVTETFEGTQKLSTLETTYKYWGDILGPEFVKVSKGDAAAENRIRYVKIDSSNGNILQVRSENSIDITYLWGYNGTYPIAKIENAEFNSVINDLGTTEAAIKSMTVAPAAIRTSLPNAMVTTYTYKPLIGVSTITDARGYTTYYEYDSFGRLRFAREKDLEGNYRILSENEYHYKP